MEYKLKKLSKKSCKKPCKKSCKKPCKKSCKKLYKKSCKKITRKKGGFGPVSNPFIAPPKPWDATGYSYFFPFSKNGVTPGGIQPYYGRQFASPQTTSRCQQKGGNFRDFIPQPILNTFRISENELLNLINRYRGLRTNPSPLPGFDHLNRKVLRKIGL